MLSQKCTQFKVKKPYIISFSVECHVLIKVLGYFVLNIKRAKQGLTIIPGLYHM